MKRPQITDVPLCGRAALDIISKKLGNGKTIPILDSMKITWVPLLIHKIFQVWAHRFSPVKRIITTITLLHNKRPKEAQDY